MKVAYRNANRSKKMIQDAFLQLIIKKDISKIKTTEVIELADISKGTFYAHYTCLYDVQQEIEDREIALMFRVFEINTELSENFYPLFLCGLSEMERNRELYRILFCHSNGNSFLNKVKNTFFTHMKACNSSKKKPYDSKAMDTYLIYVAGGAIAVIQNWLESLEYIPPQQVARQISDFALNGMKCL